MNRQTETKKSILHSCHLHTGTHTSTHAHAYVRAPRTHTRMHTSQAATSRFPRHVENRDSSLQRTASGTLPAQKSLLETAPEAHTQIIRTTTTATLTLTAAQTNVRGTNMNLVRMAANNTPLASSSSRSLSTNSCLCAGPSCASQTSTGCTRCTTMALRTGGGSSDAKRSKTPNSPAARLSRSSSTSTTRSFCLKRMIASSQVRVLIEAQNRQDARSTLKGTHSIAPLLHPYTLA